MFDLAFHSTVRPPSAPFCRPVPISSMVAPSVRLARPVRSVTRIALKTVSEEALDDLRTGWNNWLKSDAGEKRVRAVRKKIKEQFEEFASGQLGGSPFDLRTWNGIKDIKGVTVPNIASLVFMVEEDGKRLLLTGDTQQDVLLKGLRETGSSIRVIFTWMCSKSPTTVQ